MYPQCLALCQTLFRFSVNACWREGEKGEKGGRKENEGMEERKKREKEGERRRGKGRRKDSLVSEYLRN